GPQGADSRDADRQVVALFGFGSARVAARKTGRIKLGFRTLRRINGDFMLEFTSPNSVNTEMSHPCRLNRRRNSMRRTSYQKGSLKLADRKKGKAWEYRWREVQMDGSVRRKNIVIGSLEEYPSEPPAKPAVDALRLDINQQTPQQQLKNITVETLVNHYRQHELPDVFEKKKP